MFARRTASTSPWKSPRPVGSVMATAGTLDGYFCDGSDVDWYRFIVSETSPLSQPLNAGISL
jgi:hypothetical protein